MYTEIYMRQSESNASSLYPLHSYFYRNNHLISEALEYSQPYSTITTVSLDRWQHHSWFYNGSSSWNDVQWQLLVPKGKTKTYSHKCLLTAHGEITVSMNTVQLWVRWIKEAETRLAVFYEKPCKRLNLGISCLERHDLQPLHWNKRKSKCLPLSSLSYKKNVSSVSPPYNIRSYTCVHTTETIHKFWM
jgi:hypothetical protein